MGWLASPAHSRWLEAEGDRLLEFGRAARHPAGGFAWLAWRGQFVADSTPVELTSLYWHLIYIVWIFLYPLLYLVARA